jgi:hypothetical protein
MRKPPRKFLSGKSSVDLFVNVPIYGSPVLFTVYRNRADATPENLAAAAKLLPRAGAFDTVFAEFGANISVGTGRTFFADGQCLVVFALENDGDGGTIQLDNLTHECFHVAHYIAERLGFEFDRSHDEPVAYLLGWLVDALSRHLMVQGFRLGAERWA